LNEWSEIMSKRTDKDPTEAGQLLTIAGLPSCTIQTAADGTWHVTAQLVADEQDALVTAASNPEALCQRAQHALGLAGIGSRIEDDYTAIGVYGASLPSPSGQFLVVLDGRVLLLSIAHAPSEVIQALIAAAIAVMRTTCAA
jgi:hypothetical protein